MEPKYLVTQLFIKYFSKEPEQIEQLPRSGSTRVYFRLHTQNKTVIGTYNENRAENQAFVYMSKFFRQKGLNVPEIYTTDLDNNVYLQQDLGDTTLFDYLNRTEEDSNAILKKVLQHLLIFQTTISGFDWSKTFPVSEFDYTAYMFDLNYFKYMVAKLNNLNFDELKLQQEFEQLVRFLLQAEHKFFVYRDFQSKNIMWNNGELYFIDYQGGRKGSLFYDLASLLYDSKLHLGEDLRDELKDYYFSLSKNYHNLSLWEFDKFFYAFVLVRKLQAFAAYALRGLVEHKPHFIASIPYVIADLEQLLESKKLPFQLEQLTSIVDQMAQKFPKLRKKLNINLEINSFSYHVNGYPAENAGNGGGFVFDCRALPNPGRVEGLKQFTGLDEPVIRWIEGRPEFEMFLGNVFKIVIYALESYVNKGYENLQINFGCTGGRHRSVYCAEKLAKMLEDYYELKSLKINHLMSDDWPKL